MADGDLLRAVTGEMSKLIQSGYDVAKGAAEDIGIYESDLKKAYRRRHVFDAIRPRIDSLVQRVGQKYQNRPGLWERQYKEVQDLKNLFEQAYQKQLRVIEEGKPKIEPPQAEIGMLGEVPTAQASPNRTDLPRDSGILAGGRAVTPSDLSSAAGSFAADRDGSGQDCRLRAGRGSFRWPPEWYLSRTRPPAASAPSSRAAS